MGQVYQCLGMICREIHFFTRFKYHIFYVLYLFVTYLLTLPRKCTVRNMIKTMANFSVFLNDPFHEDVQGVKVFITARILTLCTARWGVKCEKFERKQLFVLYT
jgi:hypothetical protein